MSKKNKYKSFLKTIWNNMDNKNRSAMPLRSSKNIVRLMAHYCPRERSRAKR